MMDWLPIETAPKDGTVVILANYAAACLLTGAPHVWTARWVEDAEEWFECSYAASNENGDPDHWCALPSGVSQEFRPLGEFSIDVADLPDDSPLKQFIRRQQN